MGKSGRPRLDETQATRQVTLYVPAKEFDRLCAQAHSAQVSVPEIIRRKLREDGNKQVGK